ncbi:MAG: PadR family transcriptional regulator [Solirubrobacteraceae bacterium]
MTKRKVANLLALAVLSYLSRTPMHPYELGRLLREHGDARSVKYTPSSLYMVVGQLERAGLIAAEGPSREGRRPERTVYALTDAGRAELGDWLRELVAEPRHEYPHFVTALSLIGALGPDEVVELLTRRLARLAAVRGETRAMVDETLAGGVHPLFLVEEDYRLALLDAEIGFVEGFITRITDPETGWRAPWAAIHEGGGPA